MAGNQAICNDLLRIWESSSNYNILNPLPRSPYQIDHFFEVQHITAILFAPGGPVTEGNFFDWKLGFFIDLSTFISGHENLFQINATDNQTKQNIPWDAYGTGTARSPVINAYLALNTTTRRTVGDIVKANALAMARRTGTYNTLTVYVGQKICQKMGWLTLAENSNFEEPIPVPEISAEAAMPMTPDPADTARMAVAR